VSAAYVDLAILLVVLVSVVIGLVRGFVTEVLSLAIWIAAVVLSMAFGGRVGELFAASIELPSARIALGWAIVFFGTLIVGAIVQFVVRKIVEGTGISGTDRMLGMVFGFGRGLVIVAAIVLLLGLTPFPRDPWWRESRALPPFERMALELARFLPDAVASHIDFSPAAPAAAEKPSTEPRTGG
jgi:membrane protein required for colicin V production